MVGREKAYEDIELASIDRPTEVNGVRLMPSLSMEKAAAKYNEILDGECHVALEYFLVFLH